MRIPRAPQHTHTIQLPRDAPLPSTRDAYVDIVPDPRDKYFDPETGAGSSSRTKPYEDVTLDTGHTRTRYRIPEKTVRLAFWSALTKRREALGNRKQLCSDAPLARSAQQSYRTSLDVLVDAALSQNEPLIYVPTPTGTLHDEYAAATHASLQPDAPPYAPSERSSYEGNKRPTEPVPTMYVYPGEIRELRDLKRMVEAHGGLERVREMLERANHPS